MRFIFFVDSAWGRCRGSEDLAEKCPAGLEAGQSLAAERKCELSDEPTTSPNWFTRQWLAWENRLKTHLLHHSPKVIS